ncbi:MAG: hypothetical protein PWQ72_1307 [Pseudothermotoga sp.]|jgi:AcrR family transcriptional regulator|nr:hypothetical protein [Pseudothermotoga sp.]MDK2883718.1 hypothetical protein [Pseudothermotoga sp.]
MGSIGGTSVRRQPKRSDGKKTLSNLLNSATRLFADRGYYGVSIPMIAREANVKNATFYQYFKDKESIYRKILEDSFNKFFNLMIKIDGRDTEEILESFLMNYLAFFSRNRQHYRILHEAVYLRKATFRRVEKTLNEVLHRFFPETLDKTKEMILRWFITGPIRFIAIYKSLHADYEVDRRTIDDLVEFLMKGFDPDAHELDRSVFYIDVKPLKIEVTSTRMKLLQAAEKLFGTRGYRNTMISDITRAANVASGTFYVHFKSKEEILEELVMTTNKNLRITLSTAIKRFHDRRDAEIAGFMAFLKFFMLHPEMYLIVRQAEFFNPSISRNYYEKIFNSYLSPLSEAIQSGQLKNYSPNNLALFLMGIGHFMGEDLVVQKHGNIQETTVYLQKLAPLLFKGISFLKS